MKIKYILGTALLGAMGLSSCMKEFAEVNTDPSVIGTPDVRYLFTKELTDFIPSDYWQWFYDFTYMSQWGQVTASNAYLLNSPAKCSGNGNVGRVLKIALEIENQINQKDELGKASYQHIKAMTTPLVVFMGIEDTDMYGSMPFSEAYRARYGGTLTPKYDTQEELFNDFLAQLDNSIQILSNPVTLNGTIVNQVTLGNQDFVYKGDAKKWAKFCNSLKLKIAVRLLNINKEKALKIAEEVANSPAGMITSIDDDFVYNQGSEWFHSQEDPSPGYGNRTLINFMVDNKDPRVRFFFEKNQFNSKVIQAFFDAEAQNTSPDAKIPSFIADKVDYEVVNGRKIFKGWKAPGEPWVRYHGLPITIDASKDKQWEDYFDPTGKLHKIYLNDNDKTYTPVSYMQMEMYEGNRDYTYPDAPRASVVQDKEDMPFYGLYFSAGEVNLYLAELKLIGANLPKSAQEYLTEGIKCSVTAWDKVAGLNHIPYYDSAFDPNEATIELKAGELEHLLEQPAYQLTGDRKQDLEKVYIQQRLHFIFMPQEMFVSMRRSGVPVKNSTLLPYEDFNKDGSYYPIPRRCPFFAGSPTDQMYHLYNQSLKDQGFTIGYDGNQLNTERLWYDKGAPNFGEGPNF